MSFVARSDPRILTFIDCLISAAVNVKKNTNPQRHKNEKAVPRHKNQKAVILQPSVTFYGCNDEKIYFYGRAMAGSVHCF